LALDWWLQRRRRRRSPILSAAPSRRRYRYKERPMQWPMQAQHALKTSDGDRECRSLRQLLQPQSDQPRRVGVLAGLARGRGDRRRGLRLAIAQVDQRRDRVGERTRRALVLDRARELHQRGIEIGRKGRRLVLQLGDDAFGDLGTDAG